MESTGLQQFAGANDLQRAEILTCSPSWGSGGFARLIATRLVVRTWALLRSLRIYQWSKNGLLFVPLLCTPELARVDLIVVCLVGVLAFSLAASAGYVFNDMLDRQRDGQCKRRRFRPFASGELALRDGIGAIALLLVASAIFSITFLPPSFWGCLAIYLLGSVVYSWALKHCFLLDIGWLAGLYVLRLVAGAFAVQLALSPWMLAFVACYFFQLAIVKRCADLVLRNGAAASATVGPYDRSDLGFLVGLGKFSGVVSVLILILILMLSTAAASYQRPWLLWLAVGLVVCWTVRIWRQALVEQLRSDPVWASIRDPASLVCVTALVGFVLLAR